MGIGVPGLNLILSLWKDGWFENFESVIELGSQNLNAPREEMMSIFKGLLKIEPRMEVEAYTPELFYKGMGFKKYNCIDMDGKNNALVFNLNKNIAAEYSYNETFDLVTNHGTSEHCFDQFQVFRNIHQLCSPGGIMMHSLPFQGYLNHGFFNYQPCFYRYLAEANDYRLIGIYLVMDSDAGDISTYNDAIMDRLCLMPNTTMLLCAVLQKQNDNEFQIPFDGKYIRNIATKSEDIKFQKIPTRFFMAEQSDILSYTPTIKVAQTLFRRICYKLSFWRR